MSKELKEAVALANELRVLMGGSIPLSKEEIAELKKFMGRDKVKGETIATLHKMMKFHKNSKKGGRV